MEIALRYRRPRRRLRPVAFTLMELMVSLVILSIMLLGFSTVLSQAQRVVVGSQGVADSGADAAVVAGR